MAAKLHDDVMVWEILTRLPTKSLMRFKAVSKLWHSAISDPDFARAHRVPFRGLLLMNRDPSLALGWSVPTREFFVADLDHAINNGGDADADADDESNNPPNYELDFSFQFSTPEDLRSFHATNMVNGIICFYDRKVAKLCNIATREIINLPESRCDYQYCTYHLGFDPIESVYKLLKICPIYDFYDEQKKANYYHLNHANDFMEGNFILRSIECEILTLGVDSSWRSIDPPPNGIIPHGLCVDGVLYWMTVVPGIRNGYALYAFNLFGEKFQSISNHTPNFYPRLVQFGLSPALTECRVLDKAHTIIMITRYREGSWGEVDKYTIEPSPNGFDIHMVVRGLLPNGNFFIYSCLGIVSGSPIYLFDETRNYIQKFISRLPASDAVLGGRICWYEENIISLKRLTGF